MGGAVAAFANPFELSPCVWVALTLIIGPLEQKRYDMICNFVRKCYPPLPFRRNNPSVKGLAAFDPIDHFYITVNETVLTFQFTTQMARLVARPPVGASVVWRPEDLGFFNTVLVIPLLLITSDLYYWCAHRFMHWRVVYPYVHKHHHRQIVPTRGLADAINENPLETALGMATLWGAVNTIACLTTVHAVGVGLYLLVLGFLSVANHLDVDVSFRVPALEYSTRAHEMHHRSPDSNLAQYFMGWDILMGTYKPYD